LYVHFIISPTQSQEIKAKQNKKKKQKQKTIPSSVRSMLYHTVSHDCMHLGK